MNKARSVLGLVLALAGCGTRDTGRMPGNSNGGNGIAGGPAAGSGGAEGAGLKPYFPIAVGNRWTYRVQPSFAPPYIKEQIMERMEPVGAGLRADTMAIYTVTKKMTGTLIDQTVSWQGVEAAPGGGPMAVRYREQSFQAGSTTLNAEYLYEPYQLRLDETPMKLLPGAEVRQEYRQIETRPGLFMPEVTLQVDNWIMEAEESITVQGNSFSQCIRFTKYGNLVDSGKSFWFCRGVGKVKEEPPPGMGQIEELTDYLVQ